MMALMDKDVYLPAGLAFLLYLNSLPAEFAYDDSRAIMKNPDVLMENSIWNLFLNDFWGTPLTHSGSHKSYRPLCTLTFRINYLINGLNPFGYHLANVLLHSITTALFVITIKTLIRMKTTSYSPLISGLLFAAHPIHTEAVSGIVGRADILACLFFLLALLFYVRYCDTRNCNSTSLAQHDIVNSSIVNKNHSNGFSSNSEKFEVAVQSKNSRGIYAAACAMCIAASMLSKEHGVTVVIVCAMYDIFVHERLHINDLCSIFKAKYRKLQEGLLLLVAISISLVATRLYLMGLKPPEFSPADNPASDSDSLMTRMLTYAYLPFLNFLLLIFPAYLSFDWSMEAVKLVESPQDPRNICSLALYSIITYALFSVLKNVNSTHLKSLKKNICNGNGVHHIEVKSPCGSQCKQSFKSFNHKEGSNGLSNGINASRANDLIQMGFRTYLSHNKRYQLMLIGFLLLIFPFIPATNLFFYVGFVVAERVLYIPSMGFCILVAQGFEVVVVAAGKNCRHLVHWAVAWLIVMYSCRTVIRNRDWLTEESLYRSGISVNPAKAWGNLANVLNSKGRTHEAEHAYKTALQYRSNMADVHYNLGILYQEQGRNYDAIQSYKMAIQCRPRLTMAHLNLGIIYANIGKKQESEQIYRHCSEIDTAGLKDPRLHEQTKVSALYNLGRLLADQDRHEEAVEVYLKAIEKRPSHYQPQSIYNMLGESYAKLEHLDKAEYYYRLALKVKPDHIPAHLTLAKLYHRQGHLDLAESWYLKARQIDPNDFSTHQHYGQFLSETGRHAESAECYLEAFRLAPNDFEVTFNTANAFRGAGRNEEAEIYYRKAVQIQPDMALAHMNLGAMLHYNGKLEEAEVCYLTSLRLKPDDAITLANLNKLRSLLEKRNNHQNKRR